MKYKIARVLVLGLSVAACGDLLSLEETPRTFLSEQQFFRNAADAEAAVGAVLESLQSGGYYQFQYPMGQFLVSDYGDGRGHFQPMGQLICDQACKERYMWSPWSAMYELINRANLGLARIPDIQMSDARKQVLLGQLRFFRGLSYLHLVRNWGGVPLRLEPSSGFEALAEPRASADAVYEQIVSDLTAAEAALPDNDVNGRPTRWAAKTLLADLYLGREQWSQAAAKAREVIDSGRFSLVRVTDPADFENIYGPDVDKSSEEILDVAFRRQVPFGMQFPAVYHHPNAGYAANAYRGVWVDIKAPWVANWDRDDLRYSFNLYTGPDTRFLNRNEPQRPKKFKDPAAADRLGHGNDFPILRYPDALLIFAEATAMGSGPNPAAYEAINQVRRRAYGRPINAPAPGVDLPPGLSAQAFRDRVITERAYEFFVEAKRLWDLKRTGKLQAAIEAVGEPWDPKWMLWPIPQDELDANEALTLADQNPGW